MDRDSGTFGNSFWNRAEYSLLYLVLQMCYLQSWQEVRFSPDLNRGQL